jgi:DNA-binding NtrC family response regulator
VIERATILCRGELIDLIDLPVSESNDFEALYASTTVQLPTLEDLERRYIRFVLEKTGGKKEKASQILGINRRTLYRKERDYDFISADSPEPLEGELAERHDH